MKLITGNLRLFGVAIVVALVVGGTAYAATSINGQTIKNGSIPLTKLTKAAQAKLLATTPGPKGDKGDKGDTGAKGDKGAAGTNGTNGLKGDPGTPGTDGTNGTNGTDGTNGVDGAPGPEGPAGPQGPQGPAGPTEHNYGVAGLFLDATKVATVWTPTIPQDNNNAGMSSGTTVVTCGSPTCTLSVRGAVRSDNSQFAGQAGVGLVITSAATGQLVAAGQTPANAGFGGVKVVDVNTVGLGSGEPSSLSEGTEIPVDFVAGSAELPEGTYIVQGTVEFFDFAG